MHIPSDPRPQFFNEKGDMIPPFIKKGWRGCAIYRDDYRERMPQLLFDVIVSGTHAKNIWIVPYSSDPQPLITIDANWKSYQAYITNMKNWALGYVLFDATEQWAVLCDLDTTIFGAAEHVASTIDKLLNQSGTNLLHLTKESYEGLEPETEGARYLLAVAGVEI